MYNLKKIKGTAKVFEVVKYKWLNTIKKNIKLSDSQLN